MGYAIQVGAFSQLNNAVQLTETLQSKDLSAYYFINQNGLYAVRFGNLSSKEKAQKEAETLRSAGIIHEFFIVGPDDYRKAKLGENGKMFVRNEIVEKAESFIGVPYQWGGSSPGDGFDCSGFTMAVYRLNGLNLPRSSSAQWTTGSRVDRHQLSKADLVFFATSGGSRISHVGIYVGENKFIHAPGRSKRIRISSLSNTYFKRRYVGARSYL
jgi:cell wall-associated NlpC family hydrolase